VLFWHMLANNVTRLRHFLRKNTQLDRVQKTSANFKIEQSLAQEVLLRRM